MKHMPSRLHRLTVAALVFGAIAPALAQPKPTAAPKRRLVDGHWVQPDRTVRLDQLVKLVDTDGRLGLRAEIAPRLEPMLGNWRTAVVEVEGNPFAWKASVRGRVWNFNRSAPTQHLQLISSPLDVPMPEAMTLTKIEITPDQSAVQATLIESGKALSVIVVLSPRFVELAVTPAGEAGGASVMARSASARDMLRETPHAARKYLIPLLRLLSGGENPLRPGAADVYRAFDVPPDPAALAAVNRLLPRLAAPDAAERDAASAELAALGRRAVRAAMAVDAEAVHPEAAARLRAVIDATAHDPRPPADLRADLTFVIDATTDPDPVVAREAKLLLAEMTKPKPAAPLQ
jgi:hypothetical protein